MLSHPGHRARVWTASSSCWRASRTSISTSRTLVRDFWFSRVTQLKSSFIAWRRHVYNNNISVISTIDFFLSIVCKIQVSCFVCDCCFSGMSRSCALSTTLNRIIRLWMLKLRYKCCFLEMFLRVCSWGVVIGFTGYVFTELCTRCWNWGFLSCESHTLQPHRYYTQGEFEPSTNRFKLTSFFQCL